MGVAIEWGSVTHSRGSGWMSPQTHKGHITPYDGCAHLPDGEVEVQQLLRKEKAGLGPRRVPRHAAPWLQRELTASPGDCYLKTRAIFWCVHQVAFPCLID